MKKKYEKIKTVLILIKYNDQKWVICGDLEIVNFLMKL